jgi:4-hydroxybenzoyl-CoA thioesterase
MAFEHSVTVRFAEVDSAGFVYFSRLFEYCHVAYEELVASIAGESLGVFFSARGWGTPVVHAEADFERPIRLGERLRVSLSVSAVGERSMTVDYVINGVEDGGLRARARLVHAFIDMQSLRPIPVPADFAGALEDRGVTERKSS